MVTQWSSVIGDNRVGVNVAEPSLCLQSLLSLPPPALCHRLTGKGGLTFEWQVEGGTGLALAEKRSVGVWERTANGAVPAQLTEQQLCSRDGELPCVSVFEEDEG